MGVFLWARYPCRVYGIALVFRIWGVVSYERGTPVHPNAKTLEQGKVMIDTVFGDDDSDGVEDYGKNAS